MVRPSVSGQYQTDRPSVMGNLPAWFLSDIAEDAVRAVMRRTPRTVLHHDPPIYVWHWESRPTLWQRLLSRWCRLRGHQDDQWLTEAWSGREFCWRCGQQRLTRQTSGDNTFTEIIARSRQSNCSQESKG